MTGVDTESRKAKRNAGQKKRVDFGNTIDENDIKQSGIVQFHANDPNKAKLECKTILANVADPTTWAGDEDFLLIQYKKALNIFLIDNLAGKPYVEIPPSGICP